MKTLLTATLCCFATYAQAHPGHDHSHWMSEPIHWLTILSIVAVGAAAYQLKKQHNRKVHIKTNEDK